jgi:hypothetical protein
LGSPEHHPRSLRGHWRFLRGVLVVFDIRDAHGYFKEAMYQFSDLYHPGKLSNSRVLQSVIQGI